MKKNHAGLAALVIMLALAVVASAWAAGVGRPPSLPQESVGPTFSVAGNVDNTLLSVTNTTGFAGAVFANSVDIGYKQFRHDCSVSSGVTNAPTSASVEVWGSPSNTRDDNFDNYSGTVAIAKFPTVFHIKDRGARYLIANLVSITGGDATTRITMKCNSGGW